MLIRSSGFLFRRMLTECLKRVASNFWQVELAVECLKQRLDIKKMLHSYTSNMTGNSTSKQRVLGFKALGGERESTHLCLLSTFSGIRVNKGSAMSVGRTFQSTRVLIPSSLSVKDHWLNVMDVSPEDIFIFTCEMGTITKNNSNTVYSSSCLPMLSTFYGG